MIFVGVGYSCRAGFSMGVENFYIEKGSAKLVSPESICLDVTIEAFQQLKFRLYFNIMAYFVLECCKGIANFIVLGECIHLWDNVESESV